jgi:hypothetical protein
MAEGPGSLVLNFAQLPLDGTVCWSEPDHPWSGVGKVAQQQGGYEVFPHPSPRASSVLDANDQILAKVGYRSRIRR